LNITLSWKGLLVIALLFVGVIGYSAYRVHKDEATIAAANFSKDSVVLAKKGVEVVLASTSASKDSLKTQLDAAHTLNGTLVAGVNINVKQPTAGDIAVKPILVEGEGFSYMDTSNVGVITATVNCTTKLFTYHFDFFPINISVGEIQLKNDSAVFVVRVRQNGKVEDSITTHAAFAQKVIPFKRLKYFIAGYYNPFGPYWDGEAGAEWQVPVVTDLYVAAAAWQPFIKGQSGQFLVGVRKEF
jgi:hypothetical protein